jgi:superfamily I DNA and/or RNA helicase
VVAPYNAQVRLLRRTLQAAGLGDVPVGTVDKFQGREAAVVFYSMATSSAEDVPRTLDFLFSRNRLNVAVSRAMCLACIVASPRLLESRARTIEQMRLINALCRFAEMAGEQVSHPGR